MKKKACFAIAVFMLIAILLASGCGGSETTPAENGGQVSPDANSDEVITVVFGSSVPPVVPQGQAFQKWGDRIEELSQGRVKFEYYWNWALIPTLDEIPRGVAEGICDVHSFFAQANITPLHYGLLYLPFMNWPSLEDTLEILKKLQDKFPELREEYSNLGVKLYATAVCPPGGWAFKNKEVRTPQDLEGIRFLAVGVGPTTDFIELAGGIPMQVGFGDLYMALERGMGEGAESPSGAAHANGIIPLLPYNTMFGESGLRIGVCQLIMNNDFYNNLPSDIKQIFDDSVSYFEEVVVEAERQSLDVAIKEAEDLGHTIIWLTPEELKVWQDFAIPIHEKWIEEMERRANRQEQYMKRPSV